MGQINPPLPTPGASEGTWGTIVNTALAATIQQGNQTDLVIHPASNPTAGKVLTQDGSGGVTWAAIPVQAVQSSGGGVTAKVDGTTVTALTFATGVTSADVGAVPRPTGTPVLGQVAAVTAVSPLATGWVTPSTGTGSSSSTGGTNVLNAGVKNDGIILNDLVVNSGSTTITSSSNPFTSTAVDGGKLVYWRTSSGVAFGTITSVQSTSSATLSAAASASVLTDGGPNTNSVFGTDNTAALNSLFTTVQAPQIAAGSLRVEQTPSARVHFPAGVYVTKALNVMKGQGIVVSGDGMHNTYIASGDDNPWFQLDTVNLYYAYSGNATYWEFRDLQFINPCHRNGSSVNNRKGIAIQDNGSGNVLVQRAKFVGLRYGFASPTASDFSKFQNCYFYLCDVGSYIGLGAQQVDFFECDWALCNEGAVFEGSPQWHIGGGYSFEDNVKSAITIEGKSSGTSRFGAPVDLGGAFYSGTMIIDGGGWFETNSGGNGTLTPRQILITGDGPFGRPFEGLVVRDCLFVAGGNQVGGGTNTFIEINSNRNDSKLAITIDHLTLSNPCFVNSIVRNSGNANPVRVAELFCIFPSFVAETQGNVVLRAQRADGTMTGFSFA